MVQQNQAIAAEILALAQTIRASQPPAPVQQRQIIARDNAQIGVAMSGDVGGDLTLGPVDMSRKIFSGSGTRPAASHEQAAPAPTDAPLPATLSSDGVHFSFGHALLIGVGAYTDPQLNAPSTAADATRLAGLLHDPAAAAYPAEQVQLLRNAQASRAQIIAALDAFAERLRQAPQPTVLLFFAGHGVQHGEQYFLLPHDGDHRRPAATGIDAATFTAKAAAIAQHSQKLLVLLNCCHAGGVGDACWRQARRRPGATRRRRVSTRRWRLAAGGW
jgi:hypothetical protein